MSESTPMVFHDARTQQIADHLSTQMARVVIAAMSLPRGVEPEAIARVISIGFDTVVDELEELG